MNWTLYWKALTLLVCIAALTAFLVLCSEGSLHGHPVGLRPASPL